MPINPLRILNQDIPAGKTILHLDIAKLHTGTPIDVPVIIQRAKKDGPTLLLMAGIHGNEVNGVEIVRQLIRKKHNVPKAGSVICIPVVNVFGFLNMAREFPDGRDLNRVFPGTKTGSLASRFAYHIMQEIIPHVDYVIDFHTGGDERFNYSQIRLDAMDAESLELAIVFGTRFIMDSQNRTKSFRNSVTKLGKKVLLFEGGKTLDLDKNVTKSGISGTQRVMNYLGMSNQKEIEIAPENPLLLSKTQWVRASKSGMYRSHVTLGDFVIKGELLGSISDPYGSTEYKIKAPNDGHIICSNHAPLVNQGDALMHISVESSQLT
ncbi:succinylglutamate desuccinylase/aspartoacylase family protein [Bacteroidia bacterium]|nr:succinylglutamate desuccinylase/aspartoacylase family protein [Bacteroidia bacterium]MDC1395489.1 succinylglutamate desuccinylase/aspartoacylase family protein [Bacteroidia bacterium]